jgi:hypothetical protein
MHVPIEGRVAIGAKHNQNNVETSLYLERIRNRMQKPIEGRSKTAIAEKIEKRVTIGEKTIQNHVEKPEATAKPKLTKPPQLQNQTSLTSHLTVTFITLFSHAKLREAELQWVIVKLTLQNTDHSPTCLDTAPNERSPESGSGQKPTRKLQGS